MKFKAVVATTHVDKHQVRITKEALEKAAKDIRVSGAVPAIKIEHDNIIPPIGKVIDGWVEKREDGEYQLVVVQEVFNKISEVNLPDSSIAYCESSESDSRPFVVEKEGDFSKDLKISVDLVNFEKKEEYEKFICEIKQIGDFDSEIIGRKSFIPDPEMIIAISKLVLVTSIGKKVVDKLGDKAIDTVLDDIVPKAYQVIKKAVYLMAQYAIPKNRPITYIFLIPGDFNIKLAVRTNDPNIAMTAILQENIAEVLEKAEEFNENFDASEIQFLFNDKGEWEFNFLLTNKGEVIGTPASFDKREKRFQLLQKQSRNKE